MKPALSVLSAAAVLFVAALPLAATDITVTCGSGAYPTVRSAVDNLKAMNPNGPNTISFSGLCTESTVDIQSLRNLTIDGQGVGIIEPAACFANLVGIVDSFKITLKKLTLRGTGPNSCHVGSLVEVGRSGPVIIAEATLEQGQTGVTADRHSDVVLNGVTLTDNASTGVRIDRQSIAELQGVSTIKGSPIGVSVNAGSTVTIGGRLVIDNVVGGGVGINVSRSDVSITGCSSDSAVRNAGIGLNSAHGVINVNCPLVVEDNTSCGAQGGSFNLNGGVIVRRNGARNQNSVTHGRGVFVFGGEELLVFNAQITENYGAGIEVNRGSNAFLMGATITRNQGEGIWLTELSVAGFWEFGSPNVISGNGSDDLACDTSSHGYGIIPAAAKMKCASFNWRPYAK